MHILLLSVQALEIPLNTSTNNGKLKCVLKKCDFCKFLHLFASLTACALLQKIGKIENFCKDYIFMIRRGLGLRLVVRMWDYCAPTRKCPLWGSFLRLEWQFSFLRTFHAAPPSNSTFLILFMLQIIDFTSSKIHSLGILFLFAKCYILLLYFF